MFLEGEGSKLIGGNHRSPAASAFNILIEGVHAGLHGANIEGSGDASTPCVRVQAPGSQINISGNTISGYGEAAIAAQNTDFINVDGNTISGGATGTFGVRFINLSHSRIGGNTVHGNNIGSGRALYIDVSGGGDLDNIAIVGNLVQSAKVGLRIDAGSAGDPVWVDGNHFYNISSLVIDDAGGHAIYGINSGIGTRTGLAASTTQEQGQELLIGRINEVSTVANTNDTVTLPEAVAGRDIMIINNGANTLRIFPSSGDNAGGGVDTAITLAASGVLHLIALDGTVWQAV